MEERERQELLRLEALRISQAKEEEARTAREQQQSGHLQLRDTSEGIVLATL